MERDTVLTATPTIDADLADATSCATPSRTAVSPLLPVLAALAAVVLWGGAFPAMKVAVQTLGTWQMMWARMVFALLLLVPLARRLAPARIERRDLPLLAGMALMQPCLYFLCESTALQLTTSSQAGVMAASMPLMMAVGGFLLGEKVSPRLWFGVGVSCIGVAWLTSSGGEGGGSAPDPFTGNLLELAAMACATGSSLCIGALISRGKGRWNALTLTGIQTLAGAVFFLPGGTRRHRRRRGLVDGGPACRRLPRRGLIAGGLRPLQLGTGTHARQPRGQLHQPRARGRHLLRLASAGRDADDDAVPRHRPCHGWCSHGHPRPVTLR